MTRANLLLIRELNVNGDGDFADVMIQLERPSHRSKSAPSGWS